MFGDNLKKINKVSGSKESLENKKQVSAGGLSQTSFKHHPPQNSLLNISVNIILLNHKH